tara:strand:- start:187 stop:846 length:660 start_codon:yes stop_codon:yes gene_type:complete
MAWDFAAQIHALTGFDADSSDNTEVDETFRTMTAQWLKDAAKEVINIMPLAMLKMCSSMQTFGDVSKAPGSEAEVLNTSKVLSVFAGEYQARQIPSELKYKANDVSSLQYATSTDPVFYIESNKINVLPSGILAANLKYEEVQFPTISFDDSSIASFPDEAENLVVLKASIIALEYLLAIEEDVELYAPTLANLRQDYTQAVNALVSGQYSNPRAKETS